MTAKAAASDSSHSRVTAVCSAHTDRSHAPRFKPLWAVAMANRPKRPRDPAELAKLDTAHTRDGGGLKRSSFGKLDKRRPGARNEIQGLGATKIAKALGIGRASVYRVL
jgi:hypothetical protein